MAEGIALTTNLTRFFRSQAQFDALERHVIPELMSVKRATDSNAVKVWSAGCSTGEEPYTVAMLLSEMLPPPWTFEIIASDISQKSLRAGREGFYADSRIGGIPDNYLKKYFDRTNGGYRAGEEIRSKIRFDRRNIMNDSGQRGMDIVFCRNVLFYLDEAAKAEAARRLWDSMAAKSFLFLGNSESLFGMGTKFEFVKTPWAALYRKWIS
jgi:chemotaxis protein methyltransferase CheR